MDKNSVVAVTSRSFSRHSVLCQELSDRYAQLRLNVEGKSLRGKDLVEFLSEADRAILSLEQVDGELLDRLPNLKVISKFGVGIDTFDLKAMDQRKIKFAWKGGTNRRSVSELVIAVAIALLRRIPEASDGLRRGEWNQLKGRYLSGRCVGILGCGNIGRDLATLLEPFGCRLIGYDSNWPSREAEAVHLEQVTLETLLRSSDVISLHLPLNDSTNRIISEPQFEMMRTDSILINTARGGLVDQLALKKALKEGGIAGAAFDVFDEEPPSDQELLNLPNFLGTPHIGGSTEEAILAMGRSAIDGLEEAVSPREYFMSS